MAAFNQKKARVDHYEQLMRAKQAGQKLAPDDEAWLGQVHAQAQPRPVDFGLFDGLDLEHKRYSLEHPVPHAPYPHFNDAPLPDITPEEAQRYGIHIDPKPEHNWGITQATPDQYKNVVIPGHPPGPLVIPDDELGQRTNEFGEPIGPDGKHLPVEPAKNMRTLEMNQLDAASRGAGKLYLGNDDFVNGVLENSFGKLHDIYTKNGRAWPKGFFDGMNSTQIENIRKGVDALDQIRSAGKTI